MRLVPDLILPRDVPCGELIEVYEAIFETRRFLVAQRGTQKRPQSDTGEVRTKFRISHLRGDLHAREFDKLSSCFLLSWLREPAEGSRNLITCFQVKPPDAKRGRWTVSSSSSSQDQDQLIQPTLHYFHQKSKQRSSGGGSSVANVDHYSRVRVV